MDFDITLINVNLMYAVVDGLVDFQIYNPLGILQIASYLEKEGYSVDFRDYQLCVNRNLDDPFNLDNFLDFLKECAPIVGISCMSNLLPFTLLAARILKEQNPKLIIILGGVGPTGVPREIVENFDWIDYVCCGEGEVSIADILNRIKSGTLSGNASDDPVQGFYYRRDNEIIYEERTRITDLNSLPMPAYNLINFEEYDAAFSVITSRGCPYKCAFCTETNHWNNQIVQRSIDSVIDEIKFISEHSFKKVFLFQDDQIILNRDRAKTLFQRLIDEDLGMYWKCFVRIDQIDEELLSLMKDAGCIQVRYGVESGSNRILKEINKGFTIEEADKSIRMALDYISSVHASFIWGYPFETIKECRETMKWIERFQDYGCTVLNFMLSPLPNSDIYRNYKGALDFNDNIMANFNSSGGEDLQQKGTRILENSGFIFNFIREYPRVFPGFYLYDYKNNIKPKMRIIHKKRRLVFQGVRDIEIDGYDEYKETDI
ncbi:MAG: radical SAM protein [Spirochaetota bacterium]|nr:radical SAM protein [Spirochaetota bacterium]